MSSTKISELAAVTEVAQTDVFIVAQGGVSKKMTIDQVRTLDTVVMSGLGNPSDYQWQLAIVTDDVNGPGVDGRSIVYSDGDVWRRMSDGTVLAFQPATANLTISTTAPTVA